MLRKILSLPTFFVVLLFTLPVIMGNSWFYVSGSAALPNAANIILDMDGNATAGMNGGSVSDGDAISTYVERSSNAESWTESGTNRPTYKAGILNGKGVFRIDSSQQQRLKSSARTLVSAGSAFTLYAVLYLNSFDQAYKYFGSFKGAAAGSSPSMAFSSNAGYKDLFFGCDTTWMVNRWTTISSPTGSWKQIVIRYTGGTATSGTSYEAYSGGSNLTRTGVSGNDGDATYNLFGAYKTTSNPYGWNGDVARFVLWNVDVGSGGVSSIATYNLQEYGF